MIKILFLENKFKTALWDKIAQLIKKEDIEVHWIVQNPLFVPKSGTIHIIKIPQKEDLSASNDYNWLSKIDRYSYIYNQTPLHYKYYDKEIRKVLIEVNPDIVFGEVTLFHEILTARACDEMGIKYLHPSTCRYPTARFCFYQFDTLEPIQGSGEKWSIEKVERQVELINQRTIKPDYMNKPKRLELVIKKTRLIKNTIYNLLSTLIYREVYNTPSIFTKIKREKIRRRDKQSYELLSSKDLSKVTKKSVLYPLQLQPESNIDVWGKGYNDQAKLVSELANDNELVFVKPNPKSKYEINQSLINIISNSNNVIALSHDVSMNDIFPKFDNFFSPTGTINLEAILSEKVCFSPVFPLTLKYTENRGLPTSHNIDDSFPCSKETATSLLNELISSSYQGKIGDIIHAPEVLDKENLDKLSTAFNDVITFITKKND